MKSPLSLIIWLALSIIYSSKDTPAITVKSVSDSDSFSCPFKIMVLAKPRVNINKIFDKYGRLHTDRERQGIGLYLAKKIIDTASGNIPVESTPGIGSKFMIYFPVAGLLQ